MNEFVEPEEKQDDDITLYLMFLLISRLTRL
jgi:hypothetical protein